MAMLLAADGRGRRRSRAGARSPPIRARGAAAPERVGGRAGGDRARGVARGGIRPARPRSFGRAHRGVGSGARVTSVIAASGRRFRRGSAVPPRRRTPRGAGVRVGVGGRRAGAGVRSCTSARGTTRRSTRAIPPTLVGGVERRPTAVRRLRALAAQAPLWLRRVQFSSIGLAGRARARAARDAGGGRTAVTSSSSRSAWRARSRTARGDRRSWRALASMLFVCASAGWWCI